MKLVHSCRGGYENLTYGVTKLFGEKNKRSNDSCKSSSVRATEPNSEVSKRFALNFPVQFLVVAVTT